MPAKIEICDAKYTRLQWRIDKVSDFVLNTEILPKAVLYPVEGIGCSLVFECGDFEAEVVHPDFGLYFLNGIDAAISLLDAWEVDKSQLLVRTERFYSNNSIV